MKADICIIGAGLTGLSAGLALAQAGASVIILEAGQPGAGATGASGGQLIPGFRQGAVALVERFGVERARRLFDLTLAARDRSAMLATDACAFRPTGHLTAASFKSDRQWMDAEARCLAVDMNYPDAELVEPADLPRHVGATLYHGGLLDHGGGHIDPGAYALALAGHAIAAGALLHENNPALAVTTTATDVTVTTNTGTVQADQLIIACDASVDQLSIDGSRSKFAGQLMPVQSYSIATAPLPADLANWLLPGNAAVSDTRFALDYYRLDAQRRLLFSGGERYTPDPPDDITAVVRPRLAAVFPMLADATLDRAWRGTVAISVSRFPILGQQRRLWHAHGYSGHGLLLAQASGQAIADAILGNRADFDLLASLPMRRWPGGAVVRRPLYTAGMLALALRDRLKAAA
ncbi:NAD(P)/FAD-dependent oxidoreductase [Sandarakinorhabdus sp.]|uniref:NAD(P)/FAD-dependent oxidoreductase n=1 Tax=Sandarakinorhabdus sp. TaxID=1916663 RepID=UPI003F71A3ED